MKKYFATVLILFHLVSSIGYASVQQYCNMMQAEVNMNDMECCCCPTEEAAQAETQSSCCSSETTEAPAAVDGDFTLSIDHTNCCETHSSFNQLDDTTLTKFIDSNQMGFSTCEFVSIDVHNQCVTTATTFVPSDPSLHFNLPLII